TASPVPTPIPAPIAAPIPGIPNRAPTKMPSSVPNTAPPGSASSPHNGNRFGGRPSPAPLTGCAFAARARQATWVLLDDMDFADHDNRLDVRVILDVADDCLRVRAEGVL